MKMKGNITYPLVHNFFHQRDQQKQTMASSTVNPLHGIASNTVEVVLAIQHFCRIITPNLI